MPISVDSAGVLHDGRSCLSLEVNDILAAIPLLPNEWLLVKIDLILQNTDKYYMSWRRFLFVHKLLRTFDENTAVAALRTNATRLVEHLVEFLSKWIVTFFGARWAAGEVTKIRTWNYFFSTKRIIGSGPSGKTSILLLHRTVLRAEIGHLSAL